jgi:hypothetical protein
MKLKPDDFRKIVVASFLAVPFLSSLISTIHIITFFGLGNMSWMAIILALAFEIGSIASLMTLTVLDKINRAAVWFIFFVLVIMQMLGNVYYTYDFISNAMASNPKWIDSFIDLVEMMTMQKLEQRTTKFILSLLIGLPIPVISLAFLKSVSDYLKPVEKVTNSSNTLNETIQESTETTENKEVAEINEELEIESANIPQGSFKVSEMIDRDVNSQITDSVTTVLENEIEPESNISIPEVEPSELLNDAEISSEIEIEKIELEEPKDIYEGNEEEPEDSFFDDTTVEDHYDNFEYDENEDDEKKSL